MTVEMTMRHRFVAAATPNGHVLLPGGFLDPGYGAPTNNLIVWPASGTITKIVVDTDRTNPITLQVYDIMDATGYPVKLAAAPFHRFALRTAGATATAKRANTAGTAVMDVVIAENFTLNANGMRFQRTADYFTAALATTHYEWSVQIPCRYGMAIQALVSGALGQAADVSINYEPDVLGAQRYNRAQNYGKKIAMI